MRSLLCASLLFAALVACSSRRAEDRAPDPREIASTVRKAFPARAPLRGALHGVLPAAATGGLRLEVAPDVWLDVVPRGARPAPATVVDGAFVYPSAFADADLVYVDEGARVEELRLARTRAAAARATWDVRLSPGLSAIRVKDGRVEALDDAGAVRIATEPAFAIDAQGVRRPVELRVEGSTVVATLDASDLTTPITVDPAWTSLTSMSAQRLRPSVAHLSNGKVLIAGGLTPTMHLSTTEIYDPATNTFASGPTMAYGRSDPAGTVTYAGGSKVLLTVGETADGASSNVAEIYEVATGAFRKTTMPASGEGQTATLVGSKIVVIGGRAMSSLISDVRTFDIGTETWTTTSSGPIMEGRIEHAAIALPDGKVLVTGGKARSSSGVERVVDHTLIWDPATSTVAHKARMPVGRLLHAMYPITAGPHAGKVVVIGGQVRTLDEAGLVPSPGSQLYVPSKDVWEPGPFMSVPRLHFASAQLSDGRILVAGGAPSLAVAFEAWDSAEILNPATLEWKPAGKLNQKRAAPGVARLPGDVIFLAGGASALKEGFPTYLSSTEKFALLSKGTACSADGECATGFCVDGVCCDTACADRCAACDLAGSIGTCAAVKGAPRGKREPCSTEKPDPAHVDCALMCDGVDTKACKYPTSTAKCSRTACRDGVETHESTCDGTGRCGDVPKPCGDFTCDATACRTACTAKSDCVNPNHFCEAGKCLPLLSNGVPCTRDDACASGTCVDGVCCESKCGAQCEACDVPGQAGRCVPVKGKPHGKRPSCPVDDKDPCQNKVCDGISAAACGATVGPCAGSFSCDPAALVCKTSCASDRDCVTGFECSGGACVPRTSKCSPNLAEMIASDGVTRTPCRPYLCRDGQCLATCVTSSDCIGGTVCDNGKCIEPVATDDGGGCAIGGRGGSPASIALVALVVAAAARRLRPRTLRQR